MYSSNRVCHPISLYPHIRLVCGIRGQSLILTFPGSEKACRECFDVIEPVLKHAVDQLRSDLASVSKVHDDRRFLQSKLRLSNCLCIIDL